MYSRVSVFYIMQLYGKGGEVLMSETSMVKAYCKYMKVLPNKTYPYRVLLLLIAFQYNRIVITAPFI